MKEIKQLISQGEGVRLDFKQVIQNPRKIAKAMVSFANTDGGILLIGVRDNGSIAGVRSEDEKHMLELAASFHSKPEIEYQVEEVIVEGKMVLKVNIPVGKKQPYYSRGEDDRWWVYVRVNDNSILASKTTVDFMHSKKKSLSLNMGALEQKILRYVSENEKTTIADICKKFNLGRRRVSGVVVDLMRAQVIRSHTTEKTEYFTTNEGA